jgi:hypothetical protein
MMCFPHATGRRLPRAAAPLLGVALLLLAGRGFGDQIPVGSDPPPPRPQALPPTTQPTIQPTTLPALSDADLALLKHLEAGSWRDRRAAEDQLKKLDDSVATGAQADLELRAMLAQTTSPEARAHLSAALSTLAENRLVGPSLITMHFTDAPAPKVFHELFRQARWPLHNAPDDPLETDTSTLLTINVDHQPFWNVFPALANQSGYGLGMPNGVDLAFMRQGPMPNGPSDVQGPFLAIATQLTYMHSVALSNNQFRNNLSFSLEMMIFPEPKIVLLRLADR